MLDMVQGWEPSPLTRALDLMRSALELLDEANAPAELGAHLDLAICRLEAILGATDTDAGYTDRLRVK